MQYILTPCLTELVPLQMHQQARLRTALFIVSVGLYQVNMSAMRNKFKPVAHVLKHAPCRKHAHTTFAVAPRTATRTNTCQRVLIASAVRDDVPLASRRLAVDATPSPPVCRRRMSARARAVLGAMSVAMWLDRPVSTSLSKKRSLHGKTL